MASNIKSILKDLKTLPPDRLESVADYVHKLRSISDAERTAIIDRTAGSLTAAEGEELNRIIEEGCEQIDGSDW